MHTIGIIVLAVVVLLMVSIQRTYASVPLRELKRRARQGNDIATALVKAVSYGYSLRAVLWTLIVLSSALFFVFVTLEYPTWFAVILSSFLIWLGYLWLPAREVSEFGERLAAYAAPVFAKLAGWVHPLASRVKEVIHRNRPIRIHTGMYERQDFVELIERQQVQADNRIEKSELDVAKHALTYGEKKVGDVMVPRRIVTMVSVSDSIGPVLMDELHKSGHSRFPVYDGKPENIVGTLYLRELAVGREHGPVRDHMQKAVYYVHEDQSLHDAFQAILKTHHQLFIVVNSFEEYVGIITMEDVLETMIGKLIVDEFDRYDDLRAVAARAAHKEHKTHKEPMPPEAAQHTLAEESKPQKG
ncbi:CBS domain-containing protein [Candidatus Saccharibacteria bacterium]|nr:CBS domain-containing protein [Candidatus Saccharibacteria bacterium]